MSSATYSTWIYFTVLTTFVWAYPKPSKIENDGVQNMKNIALNHLTKFGYLPVSDIETGELRSDDDISLAIKDYQAFAHLPVTGVLDHMTLDMMQKPRCGMPDHVDRYDDYSRRRTKRYALAGPRWSKTDLTFRIENHTPDLSPVQIQDAVHRAFRVWSDVSPLTFTEISDGEADIKIKFAEGYHNDGYQFDGEGKVLAHAFFPGEGRGGDAHFDDGETWTVYTNEGINLFSVAAHEFGHSLGLAHSTITGSLMFPWYQGYNPTLKLQMDDIQGIQKLYGPNPDGNPTYPPEPTRAPLPGSTTTEGPFYPSADDGKPNTCNVNRYDAISLIRGELFIFSGAWFWRVKEGKLVRNFPEEISRFWYGLPPDIDGIDAVYERPDGTIVFFKGSNYWLFNSNRVITGFPVSGRPITELRMPHDVKRIDAAFVWGYNKRSYFISGDMYWRYDELNGHVDYDYPRDMSMWKGVPLPVDAAFQNEDGLTYFFKGAKYYVFNDYKMRVREDGYPKQSMTEWLGCPPIEDSPGSAGRSKPIVAMVTTLLIVAMFL